MKDKLTNELKRIISAYEDLVKGIDRSAKEKEKLEGRAYGGILRAGKGKLVESIAKELFRIAWEDLGNDVKKYVQRLKNHEVREYILKNSNEMFYEIKPDIQVYIDNRFKVYIECKAYTEVAMLKRILVDCTLVKHIYPDVKFLLFQLESQLGGDYSEIYKKVNVGSPSVHTLLSYFDIDLNIITLLRGERKVDKPIHKKKFFKPLELKSLKKAIEIIKELLITY
jgi:hypothetical protein